MNCTLSRDDIPNSINARATRTGALPKPATQWTPMVGLGWVWQLENLSLIISNQLETMCLGGAFPSEKGSSLKKF